MNIVLGGRYRYRIRDEEATVLVCHNERQRVILKFDDGRELQEVPFHDLLEISAATPAPAPVVAPPEETPYMKTLRAEEPSDPSPYRSRGW
jgi:hypothetical protein